MKETGCAGVAIGRAAWGNPWVFKAVNTYLETGEILPPPTNAMRLSMAREHLHGLVEEKGEHVAVREMRALRRSIMKALTEEEFNQVLDQYEKNRH